MKCPSMHRTLPPPVVKAAVISEMILSPKHFKNPLTKTLYKSQSKKTSILLDGCCNGLFCQTLHFLCGILHPKQKRTLQPCKEKYSTAHFAQSGSSYTSPLWILIHGLDVRLYLYWRSMFIILIGHQLATRLRNPVQSHFYFSTFSYICLL